MAADADLVRDGAYGSAWFAHRDETGTVIHVEIRGPAFQGCLADGRKRLFLFGDAVRACRLALTEAPIDALGLAACRSCTLYAATGGGMGPKTL